ncbi:rhodanese-like domain-containing protein [Bacillus tianshenii]|nr:rhodanese-like domain-containing protein [Bacillus tianshenii]
MKEISTHEALKAYQQKEPLHFLDVREDEEVAEGKIPGAKHIPLGEISSRLNELDKSKTYVAVCRSGNRSGRASMFLEEHGFNVINMDGGMSQWQGETE